jgi:hypothetical protein
VRLSVLTLIALAACAPAPVDVGCAIDGDCADGLRCVEGACRAGDPPPPDGGAPPPDDAGAPGVDAGPDGGVDPCVDVDGDGRGDGCPAGPDCDDGDEDTFELIDAFVDEDGDGILGAAALCTDGTLPPGAELTNPGLEDCDDAHPGRYPGALEVCDAVDNDCDDVVDPQPVCPCEADEVLGQGYMFCDILLNLQEANALCRQLEMRVATARGAERTAALSARFPGSTWIGLSDVDVEGQFVWADGEPLLPAEEAWSSGQPNNTGGNQNCVVITNGEWQDVACAQRNAFLCEVPTLDACTDGDDDGRGPGCAAGPDCDDADPDVWGVRGAHPDGDGDGLYHSLAEFACLGDADVVDDPFLPARAELDCDDGDNLVGQCADECYEVVVDGSRYAFCLQNAASYNDAASRCVNKGGTLAVLESREHAVNVKIALYRAHDIYGGNRNFWIGLDDPVGDNVSWAWIDGFTAYADAEADWDIGQPSAVEQRCVDLRLGNGAWRDNDCAGSQRYICELP